MKLTGGRIVVRALEDEGVPFAFGIPGTHNIELWDALAESETVRPVLVTDERSASFMADAVWRASGRLACVNVVPGAGLTHALSGICEALMDTVPLLVLGCGIRRDIGMAWQLHDVDQQALVRPVTKGAFLPREGADIYPTIREACHLARSGVPGPVFVEIPANLYLFRYEVELPPPAAPTAAAEDSRASPGGEGRAGRDARPEEGDASPEGALQAGWAGLPAHGDVPDPGAVERTVELIRRARRPFLYVGAGGAAARDRILALAERLETPVASTFQGKGVFPETHPLFLWPGFGDAAPPFARRVARRRDLTLAVGCRFSEVGTGSWGMEPPGPLIHVDIDPAVPGRNLPAEVAVTADAGAFLDAVLGRLYAEEIRRDVDDLLRDEIRDGHLDVEEEWADRAGGDGVGPPFLLRACQEVFGPETIYATDSGNGTFLAVECLRLDAPGRFLAPVDYSCMGYAVPAALGAALARPDAPVVALAGDGAFLMTGLELLTAARRGIPVVVLVLRDRELAQIAQFQETALNRKVGSRLPDYDLAALARGMGVAFLAMEHDEQVEDVLTRAREVSREGRPVVVEVAIDYSLRTWFTRGVVKTNLGRLPLKDRARFVGRAVMRRLTE